MLKHPAKVVEREVEKLKDAVTIIPFPPRFKPHPMQIGWWERTRKRELDREAEELAKAVRS